MSKTKREKMGVPRECDSCNQSLVSFSPDYLVDRELCPFCKEPMVVNNE